jgi:protein-disulfide isomerase
LGVTRYSKEVRNNWVTLAWALAFCATAATDTGRVSKVMGSPAAPIAVEIFSDYGCLHCRNVHEQWLGPLIRDYVKPGKVRLLLREYPLPGHDAARKGSEYACAADRIGKYGPVTDALFREQENWLASGKIVETAMSALSASEAARVKTLVTDPTVLAQVAQDVAAGNKFNIHTTPGIFVTFKGKTYPVDPQSEYTLFARLLDGLK